MKFLENNAKNHFTNTGLEVSRGCLLIFVFPLFLKKVCPFYLLTWLYLLFCRRIVSKHLCFKLPGPGECGESCALYYSDICLSEYYTVIVSSSVWMRKQHQSTVGKKSPCYMQEVTYLPAMAGSFYECMSLLLVQLSGFSSEKVCCVFPFYSL